MGDRSPADYLRECAGRTYRAKEGVPLTSALAFNETVERSLLGGVALAREGLTSGRKATIST